MELKFIPLPLLLVFQTQQKNYFRQCASDEDKYHDAPTR